MPFSAKTMRGSLRGTECISAVQVKGITAASTFSIACYELYDVDDTNGRNFVEDCGGTAWCETNIVLWSMRK